MKENTNKKRLTSAGNNDKPCSPHIAEKANVDGISLVNPKNDIDAKLELLIEKYATQILRLCFMYLKSKENAEDAVQETFIKAYKNLPNFEEKVTGGEKAWLCKIAANVCKDMLRSAWNKKVDVSEELDSIPCAQQNSFDDTLIKEIMKLKPKYKEVILLFYYEDLKIIEIADILNIPESTVSVRLKRAREQLKNSLGGWYYD